jgi:hypothetical protein
MLGHSKRALIACVIALVGALLVAQGCGGSSDVTIDNGTDGGSNGDGSIDATTGDGSHGGGDSGTGADTSGGGCNGPSDCPDGQACDTNSHKCGTKCGAQGLSPCHGGCCSNGACTPGDQKNACGNGGAACDDCSQSKDGPLCLSGGVCGCGNASDCPQGQACSNGKCSTSCGPNATCNGGCCDNGTCAPGSDNGKCGNSGAACKACADGTPTCQGGQCTSACGQQNDGTCSGGFCCQQWQGHCVQGNTNSTCGQSGNCQNCTFQSTNRACINGTSCGCASQTDCAVVQACNTNQHTCTGSCGSQGLTQCNGGCCNNTTCVNGIGDDACGASGGACSNCTATCTAGPKCIAFKCGCNLTSDCVADSQACGNRVTCGNGGCN